MEASLRRNFFWDYFNRFGNTVFALITSVILARLLSPEDYGLVGIALAVNAIAGVLLNLGFVSAIIQHPALNNRKLSTVFFLNLMISALIYFLVFSVSNLVAGYYKLPQLSPVLKVTALSFLINGMNIVPSALMLKEMKFKQIATVSLLASCLSGIAGITMALNHYGVWSIIVQQGVGYLIALVGNLYLSKWRPILFFKLAEIRDMLKFGVFMFLSGILDSIYTRMDVFLIAKVFSPTTLGLFTRAQGLDGTIRSLTSSSLLNVLFPAFAKIRDDKAQLKLMYYQYFELISFLFCCLGAIFYLASEHLFLILFGPKWSVSADFFKILVLAGFAYPLSSLSLSIVEARGNSRNFFVVEVIKKLLFLPTYFIAYYYGLIPYLISYVVCCFIGTFINVRFVKYELPINVWHTFFILNKYFFTSVILIGCIEYINYIMKGDENLLITAIEVLAFTGIYFITHFGFKSKGYQYALGILKK